VKKLKSEEGNLRSIAAAADRDIADRAEEQRTFGATNGHSPAEQQAAPENWSRWAREIVEGIRDAGPDTLADWSVKAALQAAKCPESVMKDIDAAYAERQRQLDLAPF
jgi:hypothetical protein